MLLEAVFFVFGVLPYWYVLSLPDKPQKYWAILIWCCTLWIGYYSYHAAPMGILNNIVEMAIAINGLYFYGRSTRREAKENSSEVR